MDCTNTASHVGVFQGMASDDATLPDDLDTAHRQIREQAETLRQQGQLIARLQHQLEQLLRQRYGKKGEKVDPDQLPLFAHDVPAGAEPGASSAPPTVPVESKPGGHGRKPLPAGLPRRRIVHDVAPEERACPECGAERRVIGEETREQLEYVPASLVVKEQARYLHCQESLTLRRRASRGMRIRIAALSEAHRGTKSRFERAPA